MKKMIFSVVVLALSVFSVNAVGALENKADADKLVSKKVSKETIGAWAVQCSKSEGQTKHCNLAQQLIHAKTRRKIASWVISKTKDGKVMSAVTTPAGVGIPAGLNVAIGKAKPKKLEYRTCLKSHCVTQFDLSPDELKKMSGGEKVVFTAETLAGKKLNIEFSLKGFRKAFTVYLSEIS